MLDRKAEADLEIAGMGNWRRAVADKKPCRDVRENVKKTQDGAQPYPGYFIRLEPKDQCP